MNLDSSFREDMIKKTASNSTAKSIHEKKQGKGHPYENIIHFGNDGPYIYFAVGL